MKTFAHTQPPYPVRREAAIAAATEVLRTGEWTRLEGAPELEADLAKWHQTDPMGREPIPWFVASGTAALEAIMLGHGIGPGDEVITTPYTWAATVSAILAIGAIPVFVDVDLDTGLLDPTLIPEKITKKTRAVMAVHLLGQPCDCAAIRAICDQYNLLFFEDGSQAHGARWADRAVGDWGDAAAFSCMGLKLLAGTEGGYAIFRDPKAAEAAYLHGKHPRGLGEEQAERLQNDGLLDALQLGWRCCAVSAALIQAQLPHLLEEQKARRGNAAVLRETLSGQELVTMPTEPDAARGCFHLLSIRILDPTISADRFLVQLNDRLAGSFRYIPTAIHRLKRMQAFEYTGPPVFWHQQLIDAGMDYREVSCPNAERRTATTVEFGFNWTEFNETAMRDLGAVIIEAAEAAAAG